MKKKILVILGHPDKDSFCGCLANTYIEAAKASGADVRELKLGALTFDPVLWGGYKHIQALEPDLLKAQELIHWSSHMVFVYPNWWGTIPALLKGFFDRTFLPGFAFKYRQDSPLWDKLLSGRTAHLIVTMDTPSWYYRWVFRRPGHKQMRNTILGFCGIKVIKVTELSSVKGSTQEKREEWIAKVRNLGLTV